MSNINQVLRNRCANSSINEMELCDLNLVYRINCFILTFPLIRHTLGISYNIHWLTFFWYKVRILYIIYSVVGNVLEILHIETFGTILTYFYLQLLFIMSLLLLLLSLAYYYCALSNVWSIAHGRLVFVVFKLFVKFRSAFYSVN